MRNGAFQGMKLSELWEKHPELFGNTGMDRFPLLVKIIDAKDDLSIQVHPDDAYAKVHENGSLGKTECWFILDCKENATLVVGHNAKTREELEQMIQEGKWKEFIREIPIKPVTSSRLIPVPYMPLRAVHCFLRPSRAAILPTECMIMTD